MKFWYWMGHTLSKIFAKVRLSYRVQGAERLQNIEGGVLIVSNHVSFLDPPLVGIGFTEPIYYFARKTLFDHPVSNFLFTRCNALPVNQDKPEISILKKVIALLKDGEKVVIFPEGERSPDGIMKMEGQPGVGMMLTKANVPVLPVRLFGPEKSMPRGSSKVKKHPVTLVVGELIPASEFIPEGEMSSKEKYQTIANRVMQEIANLELEDSRGE